MVKRKSLRRHPRDYADFPDRWPRSPLIPGAHPVVHLLRDICFDMHRAFPGAGEEGGEWSFRRIAKECQLNHKSVADLWHGYSWGSLPVIASIEIYIDRLMWYDSHITEARLRPDIPQRGRIKHY